MDWVQRIDGQFSVFNISCSPSETYIANGFAVHNCAYRLPGYSSSELFDDREELPTDKALEIVSDCAAMGVKAIEVSGGGEPTLHPGFLTLCDAILTRSIDLAIVTNGTRWSDEHTKRAVNAKWVRFSMEADNPRTYAQYRRSTEETYFKVRNSIRKLCALRTPASELIVGVGFTVTKDNWREVVGATQNAINDGADNIRISAAFQPEGPRYFDDFGDEAAALCKESEKLATDKFRVFNNFGDRLRELTTGTPRFSKCLFQRVSVEIGADAGVYRCCTLMYNRKGLLGSLKDQRFSAMWFSEETKRRLFDFDPRACPHCMFSAKNEKLEYAVCENPAHVNFT